MNIERLTNSELERLALLMEECAEVQQVIGKIIRHGYENYNPDDLNKTTNRKLLEKELGDLQYAFNLMITKQDIDSSSVNINQTNKAEKAINYLHYQ